MYSLTIIELQQFITINQNYGSKLATKRIEKSCELYSQQNNSWKDKMLTIEVEE